MAKAGSLRLGLSFTQFEKDKLKQGDKTISESEAPATAYTLEKKLQFWTVSADLGLGNEWGLYTSLPFVSHESRHRDHTGAHFEQDNGAGDLTLQVRKGWNATVFGGMTRFDVAVGFTLPIGADSADILSDEVDITSGTIDPVLSLVATRGIVSNTTLRLSAFLRQIWFERDGQALGDYSSYSLEANYRPSGGALTVTGRVITVIRSQDRVNGQAYRNSGGENVYFSPGISYQLPLGSSAGALLFTDVELPIFARANGTQVVSRYNARLGLVANFNSL